MAICNIPCQPRHAEFSDHCHDILDRGSVWGEPQIQRNVSGAVALSDPPAIFAVASPGIHLLDIQEYMHGGGYLGGGSLDQDPDLSPSFALDFAGSLGIFLIKNAFMAFFMVWVLVLFVKAMKILHGFGTGKAVGVVALAAVATYALTVALAVAPAVLGELFLSPLSP